MDIHKDWGKNQHVFFPITNEPNYEDFQTTGDQIYNNLCIVQGDV